MISEKELIESFNGFANNAMPLLSIKDEESYERAVHLLDNLLDEVGEDESRPELHLIDLVSHAISTYEDKLPEVQIFEKEVDSIPSDVAMLRVLIDQHNLKLSDFPEIGDKTLLSKILSGSRQLTKNHIKLLSERFGVEPNLFF